MASKFNILLDYPGKVNTLLDGHYQTVKLHELPDEKLQQLFDRGFKYVELAGIEGRPITKKIEVKTLNLNKNRKKN